MKSIPKWNAFFILVKLNFDKSSDEVKIAS
ncbi:hypothetical protein KORDIASMS9_01607 [Kordia sp. SMS9]|nr:hypothetical protein KORDIASMS9_01607 [Kordia sp. SMS9]